MPGFIGAGRADHDFVVREVKLERRAPGIEDFPFIVYITPPNGEDKDLFLGLAEQSLGYVDIVAGGIGANKFSKLLDPEDQVIAIGVEFRDFRVQALRRETCPTFSHPQDTGDNYRNQNYGQAFFHSVISLFGGISRLSLGVAGGMPLLARTTNSAAKRLDSGR